MKIVSVESRMARVPLTRPYAIALRAITEVEIGLVMLRDQAGREGLGAATPEPHVTGETPQRCRAALAPEALEFLVGADPRALPALAGRLSVVLSDAPAARAAVDMALHDLWAQALGVSLSDLLGRCHDRLVTSITIGIKPADEALREADEYLARGFRALKVKIGRSLEEDLDRLARLRERVGRRILIRADANQGYTFEETRRFFATAAALDIELLEQPIPVAETEFLRELPSLVRARIAADESLLSPADAVRLAAPPATVGIFNIKLMKCGGVRPALAIAAVAEASQIALMWGCMDESRIGIAAALHAALSSPATRYLDLDGSFDLARDPGRGGFELEDGYLRPCDAPGLGVRLEP